MSWLLTVNQLANELTEKKTRETQKQRNGEMSSLRGKLLMIFGDDAAEIIENGHADVESVAYRHTNFEFKNIGGLCGSSIQMSLYIMVGAGDERRIQYHNYVDDLEDAALAYEYCHKEAAKLVKEHMDEMVLKDKRRATEAEGVPTLNTLERQTVQRLRSVASYVVRTGDHPKNDVDEAIYAFAQTLVSTELSVVGVDTSYDDGYDANYEEEEDIDDDNGISDDPIIF